MHHAQYFPIWFSAIFACSHASETRPSLAARNNPPASSTDHRVYPRQLDACPGEAEDLDGFQDLDGCIDPDNDQDGIPDERDFVLVLDVKYDCRDKAEDFDGDCDEDGCPEYREFSQVDRRAAPSLFGINLGQISLELLSTLDAIGEYLSLNPRNKVLITVNNDKRGSKAQAAAVDFAGKLKQQLLGKGADSDRIMILGTNTGGEGRRVSFTAIEPFPTCAELVRASQ